MSDSSISVICPTFNSAGFVARTIQSVLQQSLPPQELIISDDGSSDDTVSVVERIVSDAPFKVRILCNPHRGPGAARNVGIHAARGEWIAFLDSDDLWKPGKISCVAAAIAQYPSANFFCHDQLHRSRDGREERLDLARRYQGMVVARQIFLSCPFATSASVCRKDLLVRCGMFNEQLPSAQDYELWLRMTPHLRVHYLTEVLGWYVDRPNNISSAKRWRHLWNVLCALTRNRRNTTLRWYVLGVARHLAVFGKQQIVAIAARMRR